MQISNQNNRDLRIEFLRAFAISLTLFSHISIINPAYIEITSMRYLGGGVFLFFVISGYLITNSFLKYQQTNKIHFILAYYKKRFFRLFPSSIFVASLTFIIFKFIGVDIFNSYISSILNIQNLNIYYCVNNSSTCLVDPLWHYWSLSTEEQFYLLAPTILIFISNNIYHKIIIFILLAILFIFTLIERPWGSLGWATSFDGMLYGIILSALRDKIKIEKINNMIFTLFMIIFLMALLIISVDNDLRIHKFHYLGYKGISLLSFISFLILFVILNLSHKYFERKFIIIFFSYIGSRTYSIYLVHLLVFNLFGLFYIHFDTVFMRFMIIMVCISCSIIIAELLYRYIEQPMIDLGNKI